ncbi:type II toxin-antitoxin system PemK/MazF family toxin [Anaerotruncus sp. 1XD42-93]|uniref:type II toxin-antitoxin system PemK/MazF family toxin n=1 Tax=Anaerotruncus sp. 1XD42-93 TaxID=2320853 RepID=UPI000EA16D44|nr:type II toxin-antitoxin system PemK/MazF family toxin [Anaerotruncus sp. 1XD42-93]NBK19220.1 type II toxin-antitoxin system PemK/MazF family toxin [Anaerotruncus sp. 1XD42-93]NCE75806.1 type II toxin-antitoxin system PemK/MazF family toxin [Anaerotruncus sp. X29]RKJ81865.1 type II toxin-antitoxin system PemK/MazF family toxin [Anaerotruncus sp. 1XD22-93]
MDRNFHDFHRGEVYYADLNPVIGHEQGGVRPVLVIQNDTGNYHSSTIIVIAVTRRTFKKPKQPTHVVLDDAQGLAPSLFMSEVVRTIDKRRVQSYVGRLTKEQMRRVNAALLVSVGLDKDYAPITGTEVS